MLRNPTTNCGEVEATPVHGFSQIRRAYLEGRVEATIRATTLYREQHPKTNSGSEVALVAPST